MLNLIDTINKTIADDINKILDEAENLINELGLENYALCPTQMPYFYEEENKDTAFVVENYKERMMNNPIDQELDEAIQKCKEEQTLRNSFRDEDLNADVYVMDNEL